MIDILKNLTCCSNLTKVDISYFAMSTEIGAGVDTWTIRNISREDGGTYECEADNGVSPADKRTFKVDIKCK